jgi:hypothetical protein
MERAARSAATSLSPEEKHHRRETDGRVHRRDAYLHAERERHRSGRRDHALERVVASSCCDPPLRAPAPQ